MLRDSNKSYPATLKVPVFRETIIKLKKQQKSSKKFLYYAKFLGKIQNINFNKNYHISNLFFNKIYPFNIKLNLQ